MSKKPASLLLLLLLAAGAQAGGEIMCCQDANNRRTCGDSLPDVCRGRPYKILNGSGAVIKEVGPPPTAEQRQEAAAEAERKKEQEIKDREQKRRDSALLQTYSTPDDIDLAQQKGENDAQAFLKNTAAQIDQARIKQRTLQLEAERFRNAPPVPPDIQRKLRDVANEIQSLDASKAAKQDELAALRARYDGERKRYYELTGRKSSKYPTNSPTSAAEQRPR